MICAGNRMERVGQYRSAGVAAVAIMLLWSGVCMAEKQMRNPSFEATYLTPGLVRVPSLWTRADPSGPNKEHPSYGVASVSTWKTDGTLSAGMYARGGKTQVTGQYQSLYQEMSLDGIAAIMFDVRLFVLPAGAFDHFEVSLLVDGTTLWSQRAGGVYLDQQVDVSKLPPDNDPWRDPKIEIRITSIDGGTGRIFNTAYWCQWDNFRLIEGPTAIEATVDLDPDTLNLGSNGKWITGYIELADGYDAALIDGSTVMLETIPAYLGAEGWATSEANDGNLADRDGDGVSERMVKFDRAAVQGIVQAPEATVTVTGKLTDGTPFEGTATIRVIDNGGKKK